MGFVAWSMVAAWRGVGKRRKEHTQAAVLPKCPYFTVTLMCRARVHVQRLDSRVLDESAVFG